MKRKGGAKSVRDISAPKFDNNDNSNNAGSTTEAGFAPPRCKPVMPEFDSGIAEHKFTTNAKESSEAKCGATETKCGTSEEPHLLSSHTDKESTQQTKLLPCNPTQQIHAPIEEVQYGFGIPPLDPIEALTSDVYCGPTPESNWVIPGLLLVGAYPASENDEETFHLLSSILKTGVSKFVCLQKEYRICGVTEEMWRTGKALRPYLNDVLLIIKNKMFFDDLHDIADASRVGFTHCPITDCGTIDDDRILELANLVAKCVAKGEGQYVHCWGGHGRTGTAVCLALHLLYGLTAEEAIERCNAVHLLRKYPVNVSSPQTQEQIDQVRRIITRLISSKENQENKAIATRRPSVNFAPSSVFPSAASAAFPSNTFPSSAFPSNSFPSSTFPSKDECDSSITPHQTRDTSDSSDGGISPEQLRSIDREVNRGLLRARPPRRYEIDVNAEAMDPAEHPNGVTNGVTPSSTPLPKRPAF